MYAVATLQPNGDRLASENLGRQGFESYSPRFYCNLLRKIQPLFPGYIIVKLTDAWRSVNGTRGVGSLIMSGEVPSPLDETVVEGIRRAEGAGGLVVLTRLPGYRGRGEQSRFRIGQKIKVDRPHSVWDGRVVVYDGMASKDRCFVLLSFMGQKVRTKVPEVDLIAL